MTQVASRKSSYRWMGRRTAWALAAALAALIVLANAHLIYVAIGSQPDCVAHEKTPGGGMLRAARSACSME